MKHITIIIPDGPTDLNSVSCMIGAYEIFKAADAYWYENRKKRLFRVELAGVSKKISFDNGLLVMKPQRLISEISATHLIIIPSVFRDYGKIIKGDQLLIDWMVKQYEKGSEIASMCTGAFILASSGLLDGKSCSTHWYIMDAFKTKFPKINLEAEKLITDENRIYTNGGGYSFLNLVIYLVEKYYDRQTAIYCSKMFQVEMDRQSQSAFIIFKGQKLHGDEVIKKAQAYIENNVREKISAEYLSTKFSLSRRNFDRRFTKATGNTPVGYAQRVKMESAKKAFETGRKTINEVMYEVGYSNMRAFREAFRKVTGISPLEYRARYNKEGVL